MADVRNDPRYRNARDETRSEMVAPIKIGSEVIGAFNLESDEPDAYEVEDMELLMAFAAQAAVAIERTRLHEEVLEKRRLEEEVTIGQRIQRSFLPSRNPEVRNFDIAGANYSSDRVGGDYYDFIRIADEHLGIVVGDDGEGDRGRADHGGVPGVAHRGDPEQLRDAHHDVEGKPAPLGERGARPVRDRALRRARRLGAAVHLRERGTQPRRSLPGGDRAVRYPRAWTGLLGTFETATYKERIAEIRPGDVLVMYSDGVTEAMSPRESCSGRSGCGRRSSSGRPSPRRSSCVPSGGRAGVPGGRAGGRRDDRGGAGDRGLGARGA